jgi:hypothetical protein
VYPSGLCSPENPQNWALFLINAAVSGPVDRPQNPLSGKRTYQETSVAVILSAFPKNRSAQFDIIKPLKSLPTLVTAWRLLVCGKTALIFG